LKQRAVGGEEDEAEGADDAGGVASFD